MLHSHLHTLSKAPRENPETDNQAEVVQRCIDELQADVQKSEKGTRALSLEFSKLRRTAGMLEKDKARFETLANTQKDTIAKLSESKRNSSTQLKQRIAEIQSEASKRSDDITALAGSVNSALAELLDSFND